MAWLIPINMVICWCLGYFNFWRGYKIHWLCSNAITRAVNLHSSLIGFVEKGVPIYQRVMQFIHNSLIACRRTGCYKIYAKCACRMFHLSEKQFNQHNVRLVDFELLIQTLSVWVNSSKSTSVSYWIKKALYFDSNFSEMCSQDSN